MLSTREKEIMDIIRKGTSSPTLLAAELRITQSGATQALQKLERKGLLSRTKSGRNVFYRLVVEEKAEPSHELDEDRKLIRESYHALSRVWSHILRLDLTHEELAKVREARNLLEEILVKRGKSLD